MELEKKTRTIEVASNNLNGGIQSVSPVAFDHKTQKVFWLDETGEIRYTKKGPGDTAYTFTLTQKKKLNGDQGFQWFQKFEVTDTIPSKMSENEKSRLKLMQGLEKYLKIHPDVSFKDANGNELNENCRSNMFVIIDEDSMAKQTMARTDDVSRASMIVTEAFKNDQEEFTDYVFGMGFGNMLAYKSPVAVSSLMLQQINMDPTMFLSYINSPERELITILRKATTSIEGKDPEILMDGELYFMNGTVVAKGFEELKSYFKNNSNQMSYLREKYGKKKVTPAKTSSSKPKEEE